MKLFFTVLVALGIFLLLFGGSNYYIGLRSLQSLKYIFPNINNWVYWLVFWLIALSYLIARLAERFLPQLIANSLTLLGSYWLAATLYLLLIIALSDVVLILGKYIKFIPPNIKATPVAHLIAFVLALAVLIYGSWNAKNPVVNRYTVNITKKAGTLKNLKAVMVSDIHLGNLVGTKDLTKMVDMVNNLHPDIILLGGDIIDGDVKPFIEQNMSAVMSKLKAKYGVFGVLGNHEYFGMHADDMTHCLEQSGVKILRDSSIKVADGFYIVGREDKAYEQMTKNKRKTLPQLMDTIDKSLPIILLDHQPQNLTDAMLNGTDLMLSGHTHGGQVFPGNLITGRIFEDDWGYLRKESLNVIVSCGFGTWGPPVRVGNRPEIVEVDLRFE